MKRLIIVIAALAWLVGGMEHARGGTITIGDAGRGWISPLAGNNGNDPTNNYIAGSLAEFGVTFQFRNHFDFSIPYLSGPVASATLTLDNPLHLGFTYTYSVFSLGSFGSYSYADIGAGTLYGSVSISTYGAVTILLNDAAVAAIDGHQGSTFSLGGCTLWGDIFWNFRVRLWGYRPPY
jgi:hypothetical protein